MERRRVSRFFGYLGAIVLLLGMSNPGGVVHAGDDDDDISGGKLELGPRIFRGPTPIGAWFGVARPCTPPAIGVPIGSVDEFPDETICRLACNGEDCPPNGFPFLEVTMIPTLLADGTVLADDFAELLDGHTTAQGKWAFHGKTMVDGKELDEYRASFIWFNGPLPDFGLNNAFVGLARPRFVTFFDRDDPDVMRGYIQPYLYPLTDPSPDGIGIVRLKPGTPFVDPDPTDPLPEVCDPTDLTAKVLCLGTLHFYIKRIPAG